MGYDYEMSKGQKAKLGEVNFWKRKILDLKKTKFGCNLYRKNISLKGSFKNVQISLKIF